MSKRINDLAFKYHIDARTDELSLFVSEIYDDGFHAGKEAQQAYNTKITLRDHFAASAMQGYLSHLTDVQIDLVHTAQWSYEQADAMLKAREVGDE